jgi:hypothetical protein
LTGGLGWFGVVLPEPSHGLGVQWGPLEVEAHDGKEGAKLTGVGVRGVGRQLGPVVEEPAEEVEQAAVG